MVRKSGYSLVFSRGTNKYLFFLTDCLHAILCNKKPLLDVAQGGQRSERQSTMSKKGTFQDSRWATSLERQTCYRCCSTETVVSSLPLVKVSFHKKQQEFKLFQILVHVLLTLFKR